MSACSSLDNFFAGDKIDYRSSAAKTPTLDVPPDLTQLARDSRYQTQGGTVSAAAIQSAPRAATAPEGQAVAPRAIGQFRIERSQQQRWLATDQTPEQLWPRIREFWTRKGLKLNVEQRELGIMETDWAENRAKLPQDFVRSTVGRLFGGLFSTGEVDKFRTRIERTASGSEIFVTHRGMVETYTTNVRAEQSTVWQPRPSDPELEAEFLARLMQFLAEGPADAAKTPPAAAQAAASQPEASPARARLLADATGAALVVDEEFDRAWRRVGISLDRSGFTVEDRDRKNGVYFVRYVDPARFDQEEPGFFARLFGSGKDGAGGTPVRYRIALKGEGKTTTVSVLTDKGAPETSDVGKRIASLLVNDLK